MTFNQGEIIIYLLEKCLNMESLLEFITLPSAKTTITKPYLIWSLHNKSSIPRNTGKSALLEKGHLQEKLTSQTGVLTLCLLRKFQVLLDQLPSQNIYDFQRTCGWMYQ